MTDKRDVVAQVKAALEAKGVSLLGPCGAFEITKRVAWALRDEGIGLVAKNPGQEGCTVDGQRYSVDAVMLQDGRTFDILINAGGEIKDSNLVGLGNGPAWQVTGAQSSSAWRAPFNPDPAEVIPAPPSPLPAPVPEVPPIDLNGAIAEIFALRRDVATLNDTLTKLNETLAQTKVEWAKGLTGTLFGYRITLKPGG